MVAATLFIVMTRGRLMTLPLPACSRAVKRVASEWTPSIEPSARSRAEPFPGPKPVSPGTGKSARKGMGRWPGVAPPVATPGPPTPTVPGKLSPVGFPVDALALKR